MDVTVTVDSSTYDDLAEANAVRNSIVHRGGVIDARAVAEAPRLAPREGTAISVNREELLRYHKAMSDYALALLNGVSHSSYFPQNP